MTRLFLQALAMTSRPVATSSGRIDSTLRPCCAGEQLHDAAVVRVVGAIGRRVSGACWSRCPAQSRTLLRTSPGRRTCPAGPTSTSRRVPTTASPAAASASRSTLKELAEILDANAKSCSHNAVFSLAYLRMTQTYGWSREIPGYYQDVPFANHQDAVFAKYYTDAYTNWANGNRAAVPQAWLIAFDAAEEQEAVRLRRPDAGHERAHQPRPAVRARLGRPRRAGRLVAQARLRQGRGVARTPPPSR